MLKKSHPFIFLILLVSVGLGNLLLNPSFESWTNPRTPANWTVEDTVYCKIYKESTRVFHGQYAAKYQRLQAGTGNNKGLLQRVTIPGTGRYQASVRVWRTSDSANCGLVITWRRSDQSFISSWSTTYADTYLPAWQVILRNSPTDTAPSAAAYADFIVRAYGYTTSPAGGTFVVDSVYFARISGNVEEEFTENLIPLFEVSPNPFSYTTTVSYLLTSNNSSHTIKVYDAAGKVVRILSPNFNNSTDAGKWYAVWDGKNNAGVRCAPGIYFIVIESPDFKIKRAKAILLK
jgi:hypothetical protein